MAIHCQMSFCSIDVSIVYYATGAWVVANPIGSTHPGAPAQPNAVVAPPVGKWYAWLMPVTLRPLSSQLAHTSVWMRL